MDFRFVGIKLDFIRILCMLRRKMYNQFMKTPFKHTIFNEFCFCHVNRINRQGNLLLNDASEQHRAAFNE